MKNDEIKKKAKELDTIKLKLLRQKLEIYQKKNFLEKITDLFSKKFRLPEEKSDLQAIAVVEIENSLGVTEEKVNELCEIADINILLAGMISGDDLEN